MTYDPLFTADPHLGHARVIEYCNRPFVDTRDMHRSMIQNWNAVVKQHDDVFLLGDISFASFHMTLHILDCLNGKKHLVAGNHDKSYRKRAEFQSRFVWVKDYHELHVQDHTVRGGKQLIVMMHYPLLAWNSSRYGSWMLHGHMHNTLDNAARNIKRYDVGVDGNNYTPVKYSQLKEIMKDKEAVDRDK